MISTYRLKANKREMSTSLMISTYTTGSRPIKGR